MAATIPFPTLRSRQGSTTRHRVPALGVIRGGHWEPLSDDDRELVPFEAPRLVIVPDHRTRQPLAPAVPRQPRRRASAAVRRRRALLALTAMLVVGLALPLGGSGGSSHPSGPALAETPGHSVAYTVQPGDTLWSIAQRADPSGDPRPLVSKMEAQTGSDTVTPGQHITVP
jgi:nucleoid-associated protein YgaU